jgi:voltage-gated potassium channel
MQYRNKKKKLSLRKALEYHGAVMLDFFETLNQFRLTRTFLIIAAILVCGAGALLALEKGNDFYKTYFDAIWYGVVSMTTTGYGDKYPLSIWGKLVGIFFMLSGVVTMSIVTGNIASFLVERKLRGKSMNVLKRQKNLFIICGWKTDMELLLRDILVYSKDLKPDDIIIIANVGGERITKLKSLPDFTKINIVQADFHNEATLRSVNLADSRRIMVLADYANPDESPTETDSKTVMAVITIKALVPTAYVCAELLNRSYERYLKMAMCDEIIYSKEYSRVLLANASNSVGIPHIIYELLDVFTGANLVTREIPAGFIGKPYGEYSRFSASNGNDILIGLLENTGTIYEMKRLSLREAQKTADMAQLVENLKKTKNLVGNLPNINPPAAYILPENSMAIFVTGRSLHGQKNQ